jgi:hypothetical protein
MQQVAHTALMAPDGFVCIRLPQEYLHNHKLINTIDSLQPESPGFDRITIQKAQYWTIGPGGLG